MGCGAYGGGMDTPPKMLTGANLVAANQLAYALGFILERLDESRVLVRPHPGTVDAGPVFAALEEAGYDVSHVVTTL